MTQISAYARELADQLREIAKVQEAVKDLIASAKDAGVNPRALRKVAREERPAHAIHEPGRHAVSTTSECTYRRSNDGFRLEPEP